MGTRTKQEKRRAILEVMTGAEARERWCYRMRVRHALASHTGMRLARDEHVGRHADFHAEVTAALRRLVTNKRRADMLVRAWVEDTMPGGVVVEAYRPESGVDPVEVSSEIPGSISGRVRA